MKNKIILLFLIVITVMVLTSCYKTDVRQDRIDQNNVKVYLEGTKNYFTEFKEIHNYDIFTNLSDLRFNSENLTVVLFNLELYPTISEARIKRI